MWQWATGRKGGSVTSVHVWRHTNTAVPKKIFWHLRKVNFALYPLKFCKKMLNEKVYISLCVILWRRSVMCDKEGSKSGLKSVANFMRSPLYGVVHLVCTLFRPNVTHPSHCTHFLNISLLRWEKRMGFWPSPPRCVQNGRPLFMA